MQEIRNNDVKMIEYVQRWFVGDLPLSSYLPKGMPLIDVKVRKEPV